MPSRRAVLTLLTLAPVVAACGTPDPGTPAPTGAPTATPTATPTAAPTAVAGHSQSPVVLPVDGLPRGTVADLVFHYPEELEVEVEYVHRDGDSGCGVRSREETIEAKVPPGAAWVVRGDERFDLAQFHFHTPSEHLVGTQTFPMEQHLVHRSAAGTLLVVGVFLTGGGPEAPQDLVLAQLPDECGEAVPVPRFRLAAALPATLESRHYAGSLTTSPYTEGVQWHVLTTPVAISDATVARFAAEFPEGDARAAQPIDGRVVDTVGGTLA